MKAFLGYVDTMFDNLAIDNADVASLKQAARDRDAALLASGIAKPGDLDRRNGFLAGIDFSKVRILKVGGRPFEAVN